MAEANAQTLPMPADPAASPANTGSMIDAQTQVPVETTGPSPRELLIGGAVLLVLMVLFFFVKSSFATWLVGRRIEPHAANTSGWSLYLLLTIVAMTTITAVVSVNWLALPFVYVPLGIVVLILLVVVIRTARR